MATLHRFWVRRAKGVTAVFVALGVYYRTRDRAALAEVERLGQQVERELAGFIMARDSYAAANGLRP